MIKKFIEWCEKNKIHIIKNYELYFINETTIIKPDFRVGSGIFIDLVRPSHVTEDFLKGCEQFSKTFGTIVVIPVDIIRDLHLVTKADLEAKLQMRL